MSDHINKQPTGIDLEAQHLFGSHLQVGGLKLNSDVAIRREGTFLNLGTIFHDGQGIVMATQSKKTPGLFEVDDVEAVALRDGLHFAKENCFKLDIVECDSHRIIQSLLFHFRPPFGLH